MERVEFWVEETSLLPSPTMFISQNSLYSPPGSRFVHRKYLQAFEELSTKWRWWSLKTSAAVGPMPFLSEMKPLLGTSYFPVLTPRNTFSPLNRTLRYRFKYCEKAVGLQAPESPAACLHPCIHACFISNGKRRGGYFSSSPEEGRRCFQ